MPRNLLDESYGNLLDESYGNLLGESYGNLLGESYGNLLDESYGNLLDESYGCLAYVMSLGNCCCATDPGVEGSNPGRVNQINHVSSINAGSLCY